MVKFDNQYRTAIHECGHCVLSLEAGMNVITIGIGAPSKNPFFQNDKPDSITTHKKQTLSMKGFDEFIGCEGGYNFTEQNPLHTYDPNVSDEDKRLRLNAKLGGIAAEIVLTGTEIGCNSDREMALEICRLYGGIPYRPQLIASIKAAKRRKEDIKRLADALIERTYLSREEIDKVLAGEV